MDVEGGVDWVALVVKVRRVSVEAVRVGKVGTGEEDSTSLCQGEGTAFLFLVEVACWEGCGVLFEDVIRYFYVTVEDVNSSTLLSCIVQEHICLDHSLIRVFQKDSSTPLARQTLKVIVHDRSRLAADTADSLAI